ncbi:UDP:flavonoid glycosyltransferase YjiC (YdhE family) [Polymorphobacter multimanifer]|uniref:UDP:flavonoid glycosyltransferase YjiC (YdhE family) n=1 Tax=Polymorphobacter multimanifer TaxID=1070431 RepID=A0A841L1H0_9SPHN|nr:nucleotide disphospho-sugar-binding domain-containing protein [Polymorphobacter multimanifer]MBB6226166.1 UDP:flavonoid glycosyltransferase YjiC (YdhE family) [Polymorphobacter multimanifer]
MARLLACWELGLGNGHLSLMVPAARALAAMGHESWLAARDVVTPPTLWGDGPPAFSRVVQAPLWVRQRIAVPTFSYGQVIGDGGFMSEEGLIEIVRAWLTLFELVRPVGIYGEHAPASLLAAHVARLPSARLGSPFSCPPATGPMPSIMPWVRGPEAADDAVANRVIRAVCRHFKAPMLGSVRELLATATPFVTSWPEVDPSAGRRDSDYYGPMDGLALAAPPDWPSAPAGAPRIFVYLPFERVQAAPLVEALAVRGWPTVWVSGRPFAGRLPESIRHEVEPVDIARALTEARLFVTRVGHASSLDALRHGAPMLLLPDMLEAETHARQLEARGLGRRPAAWTADAIGDALDALADDDAPERAAAATVRARYAAYDAPAVAATLGRRMARALRLL